MQKENIHIPTSEALSRLKSAIQGKCHYLPLSRLEVILQNIDPHRRYFIQATRNPQKFLNIISSETIVTEESQIFSETTPIYGTFLPGRFTNLDGDKEIVDGSLDASAPAAALKSTFGNRFFSSAAISYTLVIYEPLAQILL